MTQPEAALRREIREAINKMGCALVWEHVVDNRNLHTGLGLGVADLICCVAPHGRFVGLEVKVPERRGNTSRAQKAWLSIVERYGGITAVVTSVKEATRIIEAVHLAGKAYRDSNTVDYELIDGLGKLDREAIPPPWTDIVAHPRLINNGVSSRMMAGPAEFRLILAMRNALPKLLAWAARA